MCHLIHLLVSFTVTAVALGEYVNSLTASASNVRGVKYGASYEISCDRCTDILCSAYTNIWLRLIFCITVHKLHCEIPLLP